MVWSISRPPTRGGVKSLVYHALPLGGREIFGISRPGGRDILDISRPPKNIFSGGACYVGYITPSQKSFTEGA